MKSTATANSNIAFIKYWGKANEQLFLPMNTSISMTLDKLLTTTTVEFSKDLPKDTVTINGKPADAKIAERLSKHLDLIRSMAKSNLKANVSSEINFPMSAGLASSASASASLTLAACNALGLQLDKKQLSIIARQGSGSSCRSIYGGYVKWLKGNTSEDSYAVQIADENHFDIRDIIAIVSKEPKQIGSREAMKRTVDTSLVYKYRLQHVERIIPEMESAILNKDFKTIGELSELDCLLMHAGIMASNPPIFYWLPVTQEIMKSVAGWRKEGIQVYFTIDAGPNVHVLTLPEYAKEVEKRLNDMPGVIETISCKLGGDAKAISK